jgi:hypothetical protein
VIHGILAYLVQINIFMASKSKLTKPQSGGNTSESLTKEGFGKKRGKMKEIAKINKNSNTEELTLIEIRQNKGKLILLCFDEPEHAIRKSLWECVDEAGLFDSAEVTQNPKNYNLRFLQEMIV